MTLTQDTLVLVVVGRESFNHMNTYEVLGQNPTILLENDFQSHQVDTTFSDTSSHPLSTTGKLVYNRTITFL